MLSELLVLAAEAGDPAPQRRVWVEWMAKQSWSDIAKAPELCGPAVVGPRGASGEVTELRVLAVQTEHPQNA